MPTLTFIDYLKKRVHMREGRPAMRPIHLLIDEIAKNMNEIESRENGLEAIRYIYWSVSARNQPRVQDLRTSYYHYCRANNLEFETLR